MLGTTISEYYFWEAWKGILNSDLDKQGPLVGFLSILEEEESFCPGSILIVGFHIKQNVGIKTHSFWIIFLCSNGPFMYNVKIILIGTLSTTANILFPF